MTLSGNLGFVPIDEILRLLTRSNQQGAVEVTGDGLRGRVFVGKGGIDLATTANDDILQRHLVNSGYAADESLRRITSGGTTLAAIAESNQEIVDLIREMTVESLYQISMRGDEFTVHEGATTPFASPKSFELETLIADAQERGKDWAKVTEVVPHLDGAIRFRRDLGERQEVTVRSDDWKVLSEIGTGSSVSAIADHLGTTEFWAARVTARLVKSELIDLAGPTASNAPTATQGVGLEELSPAPVDVVEESQDYYEETPVFSTDQPEQPDTSADETVFASQETDESDSWWHEPTDEAGSGDEAEYPSDVVSEETPEAPAGEHDGEVEEDTEAFLEKVFSELDSTEPESDEGHGLLRRRRMGTLRDFSSDS